MPGNKSSKAVFIMKKKGDRITQGTSQISPALFSNEDASASCPCPAARPEGPIRTSSGRLLLPLFKNFVML